MAKKIIDWTFDWSIQDGKLAPDIGRIVMLGECVIYSNGPAQDHNDLCFALAAKFGLSNSVTRSSAFRFYYRKLKSDLLQISPVRKIDYDFVKNNPRLFDANIQSCF
ncbi:hypothetical protein [Treponema phagedenis]|uniref:hypothetical protein n=1 Tax=Treponema phagedenis TaxID=162 RepID=UPI0004650F70|nr:hypothetical protein [Treponema phagedenis]QEJ94057.1 hypothetical protein FUT79_01720 [Treponema phagedenis]QEK01933.1 hypothetical protein FUT84_12690 [Treponema phagedenis]QEK02667.1 hypothetical protein FUT83_01830 [Treponema phagedenis]QEK07045.1 hypothetical protein FUT80_10170 [Treponema phagedenis]QEK08294.1 hypothetical protein FUT81_01810 [Treponema phagedenis]